MPSSSSICKMASRVQMECSTAEIIPRVVARVQSEWKVGSALFFTQDSHVANDADIYFHRSCDILAAEGLDPVAAVEIFTRCRGLYYAVLVKRRRYYGKC